MRSYKYLSVIAIFLMCACQNNSNTGPLKIQVDLHNLVNIQTSPEEWIKDINFIPLEKTDSCHLTSNSLICFDKRHILVSSDRATIHVFNMQGRLLHSFNKQGKNHGKYSEIQAIKILKSGDAVLINDPNQRRILIYNLNGDFQNQINLGFAALDVVPVGNKIFACYLSRLVRPSLEDTPNFEIIFVNQNGVILSKAKPFKYNFKSPVLRSRFTGPADGGEYFINLPYGFDVYKIGNNMDLKSEFSVDFGDMNFDTTLLSNQSFMDDPKASFKLNGFADVSKLTITKNSIVFWAPNIDKSQPALKLVNRKSGNHKSLAIDDSESLGFYHGVPILPIYCSYGEYIAQLNDAKQIVSRVKSFTREQVTYWTVKKRIDNLKSITENDNPVVIIYRIEDF